MPGVEVYKYGPEVWKDKSQSPSGPSFTPAVKAAWEPLRDYLHSDSVAKDDQVKLQDAANLYDEKRVDALYPLIYAEGKADGKIEAENNAKTQDGSGEESKGVLKSRLFWAAVVGLGSAGIAWLATWLIERNKIRPLRQQLAQAQQAAQNVGSQ